MIDPVAFSVESVQPASTAEDGKWLLHTKMRNHSAVGEFVRGNGNRAILSAIIAMHNMSRQLLLNGFGVDLSNIILESDKAIHAIVRRKNTRNSFTLAAQEIRAFNELLELHDAQMDVATIGDVTKALNDARRQFSSGRFTKLSTKFIGDLP